MKILSNSIAWLLCLSSALNAQFSHQLGIDLGTGVSTIVFGDQASERQVVPGLALVTTLQYNLCWREHWYLGMGVGIETSYFQYNVPNDFLGTYYEGLDFEARQVLFPITLGYRSPFKRNVGFVGALVALPTYTYYYGHRIHEHALRQSDPNEAGHSIWHYVEQPHHRLCVQLGANIGVNFKVREKIQFQLLLQSRVDLLERSVAGEHFFQILTCGGFRFTL